MINAYDDCINLCWAPPSNTGGSRVLGYILEKRKKGSNLWTVVNAVDELIKGLHFKIIFMDITGIVDHINYILLLLFPENKYAVKDVVAGMEYEFRVTAINLSGVGEFSNPSEFVIARDPKSKCCSVLVLSRLTRFFCVMMGFFYFYPRASW